MPSAARNGARKLVRGTALVNVLLPTVHPRVGTAPKDATPAVTLLAHVAYGAVVGGITAFAH